MEKIVLNEDLINAYSNLGAAGILGAIIIFSVWYLGRRIIDQFNRVDDKHEAERKIWLEYSEKAMLSYTNTMKEHANNITKQSEIIDNLATNVDHMTMVISNINCSNIKIPARR